MTTSRKAFPSLWLPYTQMLTADAPLKVIKAQETTLFLEGGQTLVDGLASWWSACHGYQHPALIAAMETQLKLFPHVMMAGLVHDPAVTLADKLVTLLPGELAHVFFSESGSVSVEVSLKIALQYWREKGEPKRTRFLAFSGGYHGDTLAAMSVSDTAMHKAYQGALLSQDKVALPETAAQKALFDHYLETNSESLAAMIIEPLLQGAGGMLLHSPETLAYVAKAAKKHGILLICDEIFTGLGRTGTLFAVEQAGVVPDIMLLSKALSGGTMPLAATVATRGVFEAFLSSNPGSAFMHGPTYMGHALACATALASLHLFETEPRLQQVKQIERLLAEGLLPLRDEEGVAAVRVKGAMGAVVIPGLDVAWARKRALEAGVFLRPFSDVLYTTPAFTMDEAALMKVILTMQMIAREAPRYKNIEKIA